MKSFQQSINTIGQSIAQGSVGASVIAERKEAAQVKAAQATESKRQADLYKAAYDKYIPTQEEIQKAGSVELAKEAHATKEVEAATGESEMPQELVDKQAAEAEAERVANQAFEAAQAKQTQIAAKAKASTVVRTKNKSKQKANVKNARAALSPKAALGSVIKLAKDNYGGKK